MKKPQRRIVLTGFMGAGKSTVAIEIAKRLRCRLIDLDDMITQGENRTISAIMEEAGEAQFRKVESTALAIALQDRDADVIALGGGTWTLEQNRHLIREHNCYTVWLDTPFEVCWQRIGESNHRPLAVNEKEARRLFLERQDSYSHADLRILVYEGTGSDDLAREIIEALPS